MYLGTLYWYFKGHCYRWGVLLRASGGRSKRVMSFSPVWNRNTLENFTWIKYKHKCGTLRRREIEAGSPEKSHPSLLYLPFLLKEWEASDRQCVYVIGNTAHIMTPHHQACLSYLKTNQYSLLLVLEFIYPDFNLITKPQCFEYGCQPSLSLQLGICERQLASLGTWNFFILFMLLWQIQDMPPLLDPFSCWWVLRGSRPTCVFLSHVVMSILVPTHILTTYLPEASLAPKLHLRSAVAPT